MMTHSIREGWSSLRRQRRLTLLLWAWTLLLGMLATFPVYQLWNSALGSAPEADLLLEGLSLRIFAEITANDQNSAMGPLVGMNAFLLLLALLASPLVAGGTLEILVGQEGGPTLARFASGAGRYFWRFLRLMILGGMAMAIGLALISWALGAIVSKFSEAGWEATAIVGGMTHAAVIALAAGCFTVVLDFARIRMVLEPTNRSVKSLFSAMRLVFFRGPGALTIAALFGALAATAWLAAFLVNQWLPTNNRMMILLALMLMQALLLARCALRVGMLAAATHYAQATGWVVRPQPPEVLPEPPPEVQELEESPPDLIEI